LSQLFLFILNFLKKNKSSELVRSKKEEDNFPLFLHIRLALVDSRSDDLFLSYFPILQALDSPISPE